tara:strand:- start:1300 stop:1494 length:195 start_codon:yes stop_codon:yes gene_type:complete
MIDREDLENVFQQSPDHQTHDYGRPGNVADALFYIGDALYGIRDEMKERNAILEKNAESSWMEK